MRFKSKKRFTFSRNLRKFCFEKKERSIPVEFINLLYRLSELTRIGITHCMTRKDIDGIARNTTSNLLCSNPSVEAREACYYVLKFQNHPDRRLRSIVRCSIRFNFHRSMIISNLYAIKSYNLENYEIIKSGELDNRKIVKFRKSENYEIVSSRKLQN